MSGLLLLATVALVLWGCIWVAKKLGSKATTPPLRSAIKWLVLLVLLSLPFVDEVIGKYQFEALCKANGIESADVSKARGKRVKVEYGERKFVEGTIMPIQMDDVFFRNADSGEVLIRYKDYYALGGWLMRYTWLSMGSQHSMLFPGNGCGFSQRDQIFKTNQILQIN